MKKIGAYEITQISVIVESAGDTEPQSGVYIHNTNEPFADGDFILVDYTEESFSNEYDVENAAVNDTAFTYWERSGDTYIV